jgi:hypothetical protein
VKNKHKSLFIQTLLDVTIKLFSRLVYRAAHCCFCRVDDGAKQSHSDVEHFCSDRFDVQNPISLADHLVGVNRRAKGEFVAVFVFLDISQVVERCAILRRVGEMQAFANFYNAIKIGHFLKSGLKKKQKWKRF